MLRLFSVRVTAIGFACLLGSPATGASNLSIAIDPDGRPMPSSIDLGADGEPPIPLSAGKTDRNYEGQLPRPTGTEWEMHYIVTAHWPDGNRQLYLRVTPETPPAVTLAIYNENASADQTTLNRLNALGNDFYSLLEKYFVARDVYRELMSVNTAVKDRALRLWFDAAFLLQKHYHFIDRDTEVEDLARRTGDGYYLGMLKNIVAFDWQDASRVKSLIDGGQIEQAAVLNNFLVTKYSGLDAKSQQAVTSVAHIDMQTLQKNDQFVSTLRQMASP